ncbi:hypothetical protein [Methylocystis bryophila]|uniref:PEP-CTERM sorting domain-containing protein n=1 Tax=Methylocystis bryophila TaxID=655015 RepID=A0A1W6MXK0_9HYPH|nr:hypothetical protein [Methylocystis bryophila]ARN82328.1 hypothetical protein B1812_15915 [Methylocystis bryophila]BDV38479.1 hypothetical protein DSM21852_17320 [Methylocystis bryophila]
MKSAKYLLAVGMLLGASSPSLAAMETLDITWSGASFGNQATATGSITFDNSVFPLIAALAPPIFIPNTGVSNITVTITDPQGGGGTFTTSDFASIIFWSSTPLNLGQNLIGQPVGAGCAYGPSTGACAWGDWGDFNLWSPLPGGPRGSASFTLTDAAGDHMLVTSMVPASAPAPVPGVGLAGLAALALAGLFAGARRT